VKIVEKPSVNTVIAIAGPTAVGKTSVAIKLAQYFGTEIISFDSRQFYQQLKIGAAPPSAHELAQVKHHFIGHLSVDEEWNAGQFEDAALQKAKTLFQTYNPLILVGGSGLYLRAFSQGLDKMPTVSPSQRAALIRLLADEGLGALQQELKIKDPEYFEKVDIHNPQRLMRALELIRGSNTTYTELRKQKPKERPFKIITLGLNLPRHELYERINLRVDQMIADGLVEEVKALRDYQTFNALQTVGYKELFKHFNGELSAAEAVEEIKKNSRRYAKRQLTWFRKDPSITWFNPNDLLAIKTFLQQQL
jgi:tRNA dimethylallyltransferase